MTSTKKDWERDLKKGEMYEQLFFALLVKKGLKPEYSRKLKEWDIRAGSIKFEVKADSYTKNNGRIAVETWSNRRLDNLGWLFYTTADVLIYFISGTEYYWIDMKYLRDTMITTTGMYEEKQAAKAGNLDAYIMSVPIKELNPKFVKLKQVMG